MVGVGLPSAEVAAAAVVIVVVAAVGKAAKTKQACCQRRRATYSATDWKVVATDSLGPRVQGQWDQADPRVQAVEVVQMGSEKHLLRNPARERQTVQSLLKVRHWVISLGELRVPQREHAILLSLVRPAEPRAPQLHKVPGHPGRPLAHRATKQVFLAKTSERK